MRLILASQSPARLTTLSRAGLSPEVVVSGVDESVVVAETPTQMVTELATLKGEAVRAQLPADTSALLVACDTVLEFDNQIWGKPRTQATVVERWRQMRGRRGVIHTGHYVARLEPGAEARVLVRKATTAVAFGDLSDDEILAYATTGEPHRCAGGFTIDAFGGPFISRVEGDPHNVVGISLPLLRLMFADLGGLVAASVGADRMTRPLAFITGGSRGIGFAIAQELSTTHDLIIGGRRRETVDAAIAALPAGTRGFVCDLNDGSAVESAVTELGLAGLDVLVQSAGVVNAVVPQRAIAETPREEWTRVLTTNVTAVADLTRLMLPALRAASGHVVAINSGSGFRSGPGGSVYSASKFALRAFTDALREEERGLVRVTSIHPGRVATDMQASMWADAGADYRADEHLSPTDVAATVRLAVDLPSTANVDELSIRPAVQKNP